MTLLLALAVAALAPAPNGEAHECSIRGRVLDDRGAPVPGATLAVLRDRAGGFGMLMFPANFPVADRDGAYCIPPMPLGEYLIRAFHRAQPPSSSPNCASCCDPSFEFEPTSHAVMVSQSRATTATRIVLRRVPAYCVRGEVRDSRGALASGVHIVLEMPSGSGGVFNDGGRFLLAGLPAGNYTVLAFPPGQGRDRPPLAFRQFRITNHNVNKLVIVLPSRR